MYYVPALGNPKKPGILFFGIKAKESKSYIAVKFYNQEFRLHIHPLRSIYREHNVQVPLHKTNANREKD